MDLTGLKKTHNNATMSKVRSMTGYGRAGFSVGNSDFTVEVASVNQRGLAVSVAAPSDWMPDAERLIVSLVREYAARGKVSVTVRYGTATGASGFNWDSLAVEEAVRKLKACASRLRENGLLTGDFSLSNEMLLRLAELNRTTTVALPGFGEEGVSDALAASVRDALGKFVEMRSREGENLEKDFRERLGRLRDWAAKIREASAGTVENQRTALRTRLTNLRLEIDLDDPRFLKEIALFADRCDIAEELTRLDSHFAQFEACLAEEECGRKLDFICQEILREFNTIGSKANNAGVTCCVVEAKNEQERLREQVQNAE